MGKALAPIRPDTSRSPRSAKRFLWWTLGLSAVLLVAVGLYFDANYGTPNALTVGAVLYVVVSLVAAGSCLCASRRNAVDSWAWRIMTVGVSAWGAGAVFWLFYDISRDHVYPFPSLADFFWIGYAVPVVVALLLFPRPATDKGGGLRPVLDALVIATAVIFISWALVLGTVLRAGGETLLALVTGLGYPIADVVVASLVLALGMRRLPGQRLPWLFLGGGLLTLAVTDSIYVGLTFQGVTETTGSVLNLGWAAAFLLIAIAPWVKPTSRTGVNRRVSSLVLELLPYVPVLAAILVLSGKVVDTRDPVLLVIGALLLLFVAGRQILIVFENTATRELQAQLALRNAELEGLGAIVNSSSDAIMGKTPDGVITSWNPGAADLFGYPAEDVLGKNVSFLIPPDRRAEEVAVMSAAREGGQARRYETDRVRKDGSLVPVSLTVSPIVSDQGDVRGVATIAQDITERRVAEAELASARQAALESSRLKSEFLATMSHEIRTPMNGVIGLTGLLLQTQLDDSQRQYVEGVKGAGAALLAVINDILDFSKLEAGKVDLELGEFDPRLLVEEVAALLAPAAQPKRLELIAYCRPDVPAMLVGDAGRLRQIVLNLASNAVKFTEAGEVSVSVHSVEQQTGPAMIRFEVTDTGIGVSSADSERLFESFAQADASTTRRYGGTGLGLAISRRLTEAMGGEIGVVSELGTGSTFWFQVPLPVSDAAPGEAFALSPDLLDGLPVLVVDDNATNRLVLVSQLTHWRMRPEAVEHPGTVIGRMREAAAAGRPYAIAVLDMCMPEIDGLKLATLISADPLLHSTRLIILTSGTPVDRDQLKAAGVAEWLTKPVRSSEFYDRLMRLMAPKQVASGLPPTEPRSAKPAVASLGRILVVEDNALNQLVAERVLTNLGYQVDLVANGREALAAVAATPYAAVLMDCHMPIMDGFEATRAIRSRDDVSAGVPIIAMTAGAMAEDRDRCLAAGMDDYISKPFDISALEQTLTRWVGTVQPAVALT